MKRKNFLTRRDAWKCKEEIERYVEEKGKPFPNYKALISHLSKTLSIRPTSKNLRTLVNDMADVNEEDSSKYLITRTRASPGTSRLARIETKLETLVTHFDELDRRIAALEDAITKPEPESNGKFTLEGFNR